jgi:uncharacterized membrane protein YcaP (DUF421 family)
MPFSDLWKHKSKQTFLEKWWLIMEVSAVIGRSVFAFVTLWLMTRFMGRKQITQMTFFNYITGIAIGSIAADITVDPEVTFIQGGTGIVSWAILTILVGYMNLKSRFARKVIDGQPEIVIKQGKVMEDSLRRLRLDLDELTFLLRLSDRVAALDRKVLFSSFNQ